MKKTWIKRFSRNLGFPRSADSRICMLFNCYGCFYVYTLCLLFCNASYVYKLSKTIFLNIFVWFIMFAWQVFFNSLTKCRRVTKILFIHKCFFLYCGYSMVWICHSSGIWCVFFYFFFFEIMEFIAGIYFTSRHIKRGKKEV